MQTINLGRRDFIKGTLISSVSYLLTSLKTTKALASYNDSINNIINKPLDTVSEETEKKIDKTKELIGEFEYEFFINFFLGEYETYGYNEILEKIKEIQKENNLKIDGVIGKRTLKVLYIKYYNNNIEKLDYEIFLRLKIYKEMSKYKNATRYHPKHGILKASSIPDVFNNKYYYGQLGTQNLEGSYIDNSLFSKVDQNINKKGNNAYLKKIDGKFVVLVYIDGKLKLASYTSPGNPKLEKAVNTSTGSFKSILKKYSYKEMYHISGADASVKDGKGAIMPYAVHVTGGVFAHAGNVNGNKLSHGCIRIPLLYAKGLYSIFMKYGDINWNIKDTN